MDRKKRLQMYKGRAAHKSSDAAEISDTIPMGGIAPDIKVYDIINTASGLLCYRY